MKEELDGMKERIKKSKNENHVAVTTVQGFFDKICVHEGEFMQLIQGEEDDFCYLKETYFFFLTQIKYYVRDEFIE